MRRRAVAPVLATLLMVAVAVAMSVIIFMWSQGFLSNTSSATGSQQGAQNQVAQSSIVVDTVSVTLFPHPLSPGSESIDIVVRNVGAVGVEIGSIFITPGSANTGFTKAHGVNFKSGAVRLTKGQGAMIQVWLGVDGPRMTVTKDDPNNTLCFMGSPVGSTTFTQCTLFGRDPGVWPQDVGRMKLGDLLNIKVVTTVGTFAQYQFTVF